MAGIKFEAEPFRRLLGPKARKAMIDAAEDLLRREAVSSVRRISFRLSSSSNSPSRTTIHSRTGTLRSTIGFVVKRSGPKVNLDVGVLKRGKDGGKALKYAAIQEFGGTVKAKAAGPGPEKLVLFGVIGGKARTRRRKRGGPSRYLTIPLPQARTPAGVGRFSATEVGEPGRTKFSSSFILRLKRERGRSVKSGKRRITVSGASRKRSRTRVVPLFVLQKKVVIPARPYVGPERKMLDKNLNQRLPRVVLSALDSVAARRT